MATSLIRSFLFSSALTLAACTGETTFPDASTDAASNTDAIASDVAQDANTSDIVTDSGPSTDANVDTDTGPSTDANVDTDSSTPTDSGDTDASAADSGPADGGLCPPTGTGASCDETHLCEGGFMCDLGRCIPQGRQTCGGFAHAPCTMSPYTVCLFETGHGDVGTCFSPAERACLCDVAADQWGCM